MKQLVISILILASMSSTVFGSDEDSTSALPTDVDARYLTGNLRVDFFGQDALMGNSFVPQSDNQAGFQQVNKSPWLAAGLSAVLPGAGEFYAGSYWKAAAFLAIEIAAWTFAYSYDKRGDRQTDLFQDFANSRWSVVKYGEYAQANLVQFIPDPNNRVFNWLIPGTEGMPPWLRVNWAELNRMERAIGGTAEGRYYSHTLPLHGDQQYYELIGKYQQYNQGWDDAPPTYQYGEPVTPNFRFYSSERGKANDYYSVATTAVTVAIVNHILSAVDAAWTASSRNKVSAEVGLRAMPSAAGYVTVPVGKIYYSF